VQKVHGSRILVLNTMNSAEISEVDDPAYLIIIEPDRLEISCKTLRISDEQKTGDMSDRSELCPDGFNIILMLPKSREALFLDIKR